MKRTESQLARERIRQREWRKLHPGYDKRGYRGTPAQKAAERRYRRSAKGRANSAEYLRKLRKTKAEKPRAHDAVKTALRKGVLVRPQRCEDCNEKSNRLHGHHPDYSQRLKVEWLCPLCHVARHRKIAA